MRRLLNRLNVWKRVDTLDQFDMLLWEGLDDVAVLIDDLDYDIKQLRETIFQQDEYIQALESAVYYGEFWGDDFSYGSLYERSLGEDFADPNAEKPFADVESAFDNEFDNEFDDIITGF